MPLVEEEERMVEQQVSASWLCHHWHSLALSHSARPSQSLTDNIR